MRVSSWLELGCAGFWWIGLGLGLLVEDLVAWCVVVTCGWVGVSKTVLELVGGFGRVGCCACGLRLV